jgi:hypothetical protein
MQVKETFVVAGLAVGMYGAANIAADAIAVETRSDEYYDEQTEIERSEFNRDILEHQIELSIGGISLAVLVAGKRRYSDASEAQTDESRVS